MPRSESVDTPHRGVKLTYDDFVHFPDDGRRHELIDGEHFVTPSPNVRHQEISGNLFAALWNYLREHPIGRIFNAPLDIVMSDVDVVEPDLIYVSNERANEVLIPRHIRGVPNLVVEIASASTRGRDETLKRHLYERAGVDEYWMVDPESNVIRICRQMSGGFSEPMTLRLEAGHRLTTSLLPGFSLPLLDLFPSSERDHRP